MADIDLMETDCIHGVIWYECNLCCPIWLACECNTCQKARKGDFNESKCQS